jgi:hypothetical protein
MRRLKYNNKKIEIHGFKFDSQKEAKRYNDLNMMANVGVITNLRLQVPFELIPAQKGGIRNERAMVYVADFVYVENGKTVIEDVKGMLTDVYRIKRKMMKLIGHEITEI